MAVDVGALRQFQTMWGPILEVIPAVIDAANKQEDIDRALNQQKKALDKAQQDVANVYAEADRRLEEINAELAKLTDQKKQLASSIAEAQQAALEASDKSKLAAKEQLDAILAQVEAAKGQLGDIKSDYNARLLEAQTAHKAAVYAMKSEIEELEARKNEAQAALTALRAKLG